MAFTNEAIWAYSFLYGKVFKYKFNFFKRYLNAMLLISSWGNLGNFVFQDIFTSYLNYQIHWSLLFIIFHCYTFIFVASVIRICFYSQYWQFVLFTYLFIVQFGYQFYILMVLSKNQLLGLFFFNFPVL